MPEGYFNIKRDKEIVSAGGFWCEACLMGKPLDDISPDPRYCQEGCYEVLLQEAELIKGHIKPSWIPIKSSNQKLAGKKVLTIPQQGGGNLSTVKGKKTEVDIIHPPVPKVTREIRGPMFTELPENLVHQWASEGMGSKAIATRLKREHGIVISYKTIQRRLQGELPIGG